MKLWFHDLVTISRPRFWLYVFWPMLVALAATGVFSDWLLTEWSVMLSWITVRIIVMMFAYFLFPANLFVYWINDLCDYETDHINNKKWTYEYNLKKSQRRSLLRSILWWNSSVLLWFIPLILVFPIDVLLPIIVLLIFFYFTSLFYSSKPLRAKAIPFLDGAFNILYIVPGVMLYVFLAWIDSIQWIYVVAWWLRCIAMHAYSAIPDIRPDKEGWITTTAVFLWKKWTLWYCSILRVLAAFLISWPFPVFAQLAAAVYCFLCLLSIYRPVWVVYTYFPVVNAWIWCILFWLVVSIT